MESKKNYLTKALLCLTLVMVLVSSIVMCGMCATASAATTGQEMTVEPRGIYTNISVSLGVAGSSVWVKAHNDFTLGSSTIQVYVYIYSSTTKESSCANMTLEGRNYIGDLNINKTLEVSAPINGEGRYWRGIAEYKLDNRDWVTKDTGLYYIDANGKVA